MSDKWEVYALKYGSSAKRVRTDSFIFDVDYSKQHVIDYFIWILKNGDRTILVDTGFDADEAAVRNRSLMRTPGEAVRDFGINPDDIDTVIITHLHYDHAGGLRQFPNAQFHLQAAEMAYATGPCMCHDTLKMPFTGQHVCDMVNHVFSGRVTYYDGVGEVAPGITVHCVGGHSRGLQVLQVMTENGPMCLASDATHFYENFITGKPFPIVVDLEIMLNGFKTIQELAVNRDFVIPGHDPLVCEHFPLAEQCDFAWRLDKGPNKPFNF